LLSVDCTPHDKSSVDLDPLQRSQQNEAKVAARKRRLQAESAALDSMIEVVLKTASTVQVSPSAQQSGPSSSAVVNSSAVKVRSNERKLSVEVDPETRTASNRHGP